MLLFAYQAVVAGQPLNDPQTGERFLSTRFSVVETFARERSAAVVQAGYGIAPFIGDVALAVAQDERRASTQTVPNGTIPDTSSVAAADIAGASVETAPPEATEPAPLRKRKTAPPARAAASKKKKKKKSKTTDKVPVRTAKAVAHA